MNKKLTDELFDKEITIAIARSRNSLFLKNSRLTETRSIAAERHVKTLVAAFSAKNERDFKKASDLEALNFQKQMNGLEFTKAKGV
jgi:hypothetical protein